MGETSILATEPLYQASRHAMRVYVDGLPPTVNEECVATFFSHVMSAIGGNTAGPGDAVVNVYLIHEKYLTHKNKFAYVEMRSVEEANNATALDGIIFEGAPLRVRRPMATAGPSQPNGDLNLGAVGLTPDSAGGLEGPACIFVDVLPNYVTEAEIRQVLECFGPLRSFRMVEDEEAGNSKGVFCVYEDPSVTDTASAALNRLKIGGEKAFSVRRANQGTSQPKPAEQKLMLTARCGTSKVLCLTEVVNPDKLKDDDDYEDIVEDMKLECGKCGNLVKVVIPRPSLTGEIIPGVGNVFLEYTNTESALKAWLRLHGRIYDAKKTVVIFYPEDKLSDGIFMDQDTTAGRMCT